MPAKAGLIYSQEAQLITLCRSFAGVLGMVWKSENRIVDFLLDLQENDFQTILFDCDNLENECLKWVQFIRRLRPRIPLVVVSPQIDKEKGAKLHEQGVFYICQRPVHEEIMREVLQAAKKAGARRS